MPKYNKKQFWKFLALILPVGVVTLIFGRYTSSYNYSIKEDTRWADGGKFDEVWMRIDPRLYIYSAYYDHRNGAFGQVQIMAFEDIEKSFRRNMYCFFYYNNATLCLKQPAKYSLFRTYDKDNLKEHYYNPAMYSCVLPNAQVPNAVSISRDKRCASKTGRNSQNSIKVWFDKWSPMKTFGVCIHSPLFDINNHEFVAGYIELNRILGAQWFTFYIYSASVLVRKLLQSYQADGLLEVVETWGRNMPNARYYGQDLSIQDCLYRNFYKVNYLVYVDLDEVILPNKRLNWRSMMRELDDGRTTAFYFPHVALFNNTKDPNIAKFRHKYGRCERSVLLETPRFLSYTIRSKRISKNKSKFIVKPLAVRALRIHWVSAFVEKHNESMFVDMSVASMFHYRLDGLDKFRRHTIDFKKLQSLAPKLFVNLKRRLCHLNWK